MPFPIEEKFIKETEDKLNVTFPFSYRNKMLEQNGGELIIEDEDWQLIPFLDKSDKKRIARTCNDIVKETNSGKESYGFPNNAIAIGQNGCGDYIVFLKSNENNKLNNAVYIWSHEDGNAEEIAKDFSEIKE